MSLDETRLIEAAKSHILARWRYTRSLAAVGQVAEGDIAGLDKAHRNRRFYEQEMMQAQDRFCAAYMALEDTITEVMELPIP